jgi:cytochrome P450
MTLFPDVQTKAQAEIDAVVGDERLPTLADRERLPYLCAVIDEILRFALVIPTPARHCRANDFYGKYLIPKGTILLPNTWYYAGLC